MAPTEKKTPKRVAYEFGGPLGVLAIMFGLPSVVNFLYAFCNHDVGCSVYPLATLDQVRAHFAVYGPLVERRDVVIVLGWFAYHAFLHVVLPGPIRPGVVNADGKRIMYKLNGLLELVVSVATVVLLHVFGLFDLTVLYHRYFSLALVSLGLSWALSIYCYAISFVPGTLLAAPGSTGNPIYDFFMGRALTPRLLGLDLKFFCEQRPGLSAWVVLHLAFAIFQVQWLGRLSYGMAVVQMLSGLYVLDTFVFEEAVLTTADITTEGFGFMLAFGDLTWVPFTYTLQARFLVFFPDILSLPAAILIAAFGIFGFVIFRLSNLEKHTFRHYPDSPQAKRTRYILTGTGSRLIISGWWGMARHINYLGDWILSLAQCMAAGGLSYVMPYWFVIYFGALLIHRERRDDHKCSEKYGADWARYCQHVPYRIIPYIY